MELIKPFLNGAALLLVRQHQDSRGVFTVTYEQQAAVALGLPSVFVQDNHSLSRAVGTLRGLHLQLPPHAQGKLVSVARGAVVDVFVDLRPGSETWGQHEQIELRAGAGELLWIPAGFAHGFCTLEPDTEVVYKVDAPYAPAAERTLAWDDSTLQIEWPLGPAGPILSDKDAVGSSLDEITAAIDEAAAGSGEKAV